MIYLIAGRVKFSRYHLSILVAMLSLITCSEAYATTSDTIPNMIPKGEVIPVDSAILLGQFSNGLTYYILENRKPENRAQLWLVVNAGSVLEDEDQLGLAHFTEHMAFNGTKNFAKQEIINYLESIGIRFGPEINAFTGFDETVYMLQLPTDSTEVIEKGFQILADWAQHVSFEPEEVDKERGVIIEEWRLGRGANARIRDKQLPILLKDSRYAQRLPIGKKEILESFTYDALKRFYTEWYRPELMAVIVVGDFDQGAAYSDGMGIYLNGDVNEGVYGNVINHASVWGMKGIAIVLETDNDGTALPRTNANTIHNVYAYNNKI